jgi:hypothetical protein
MIEINLLPKDLKPSNTTPKPRFALILVGIIIIAALGTWYLNITSIQIPQIKRAHIAVSQEIELRQPELLEYQNLESQKRQFTLRRKTVQELIESRVSIEELLDKVCELLSPTDIWFTSMDLKQPTKSRRVTPAMRLIQAKGTPILEIDMNCHIEAPPEVRIKKVAEFFESFKYNPYFAENFILPTFDGLSIKDKEASFKLSTTLLKLKQTSSGKKRK